MKQLEQARRFLAKAAEDEALLDAVLAKPEVSDSIYGFHAQQAAEKLSQQACHLMTPDPFQICNSAHGTKRSVVLPGRFISRAEMV
jgi:hypothetical protein